MQTSTKVTREQMPAASGAEATVLRFTGDISSASKEAVSGSYAALDGATHRHILLNFKGVQYMNSSGIALIIQLLMEASRAGQSVAICGLNPHFTKVFTMVGITRYATLYPEEPAALAAM